MTAGEQAAVTRARDILSAARARAEDMLSAAVTRAEVMLPGTAPPAAADPGATTLAAAVPLLLVPIRIETRFVTPDAAIGTFQIPNEAAVGPGAQLLLRVYPDTISISSFEPELTTDEAAAGTAYWQVLWDAGNPPPDPDAAKAPWRVLAAAYGPPRAAWIAAAMTPANIIDRPAAPAGSGTGSGTAAVSPVFPSPPIRASSYERAPVTAGLPDYWVVSLERAGASRQVRGTAISPALAVGLTPRDGTFPDGLPVDAGMTWLVDFGAAQAAGMGIQIPLSAEEAAAGFDRIVVFGVRDAAADSPGDQALAALLTAHHYTDGVAFVPQGAPTNNTTDASSAFSSSDPDHSISFAVEADGALTSDSSADGPLAAAALGLPAATFGHVRYADGHGTRNARDMLTAVWPATLGYFLDQMLNPQLDPAAQDAARSFALQYAMPRGPLPALRVGKTPYGVLPATSLAVLIQAQASLRDDLTNRTRALLAEMAARLLPSWQASVPLAPHVGGSADPDSDLAQVLGMDASSLAFRGRQVIGDDALWNMITFMADPVTSAQSAQSAQEWWAEHQVRGRELLDSLGLTGWDPRVINTSMGRTSYPVPYPTVQDAPLSETAALAADATLDGKPANYIQWLAHAPMADVWAENYPGPAPTSILYRVLRQSMLREYVTQAGRAQAQAGTLASAALREPELVNLQPAAPTITAADIVARPVAAGSALTWAQYLDTVTPDPQRPQSPLARLAELRASMDRLALVPTAELDRTLTETLDSASHRLDVWITALATSLLADQRAASAPGSPAGAQGSAPGQQPVPGQGPTGGQLPIPGQPPVPVQPPLPGQGPVPGRGPAGAQPPAPGQNPAGGLGQQAALHLGAYGWVENARPAQPMPEATGAEAAAARRLDAARAQLASAAKALRPVRQPHPDSGGFVQAPSMTQAAAGAVLRSGYLSHRGTPDEPALAIDLSSSRTRSALWLLAGVRQGLSLGALTGFQFEQQLHEQDLDVYIQPFRDAYPLVGDELHGATANGSVLPPSQVTDGVKLRDAWQSGALAPGSIWGAGLPAAGSPAQAAAVAMLQAIDDTLSALSDVSIAESVFQLMRGNYGRAGGILDAVSRGDHPPDPEIVVTPRPGLDVTHRLLLLYAGEPPAVPAWSTVPMRPREVLEPWVSRWVAGRLPDPATVRALVTWTTGSGAAEQAGAATVSLLDLGIGPLDMLALADAGDQPQRAELENRILLAANPPAAADTVTIGYSATGLPAGSVIFPDLLLAARALRDLLGAARPLRLETFALPDKAPASGSVDLADLTARVTALVADLDADILALSQAVTALESDPASQPKAAAVAAALVAASGYGVPGAIPPPASTGAALSDLGSRILAELQRRRAAVPTAPGTEDALRAAADAMLGANTLVLTHLIPPDAANVRAAFGQSAAMQAVDPQAIRRWLLQLSHVRPAVQRYDLAVSATRLLGAPRPAIELAQLPQTPGDRWLGLPLEPGSPAAAGRVALEAVTVGDPASAPVYAGLLLDEWLDRIPSDATTSGVAFHYDEPKSRAPQALLLAVCPDSRQTWDLGLVQTILDETLDLARARAVDLDSIQEVGQILPGLYFPFNLQAATPATHFLEVAKIDDITAARLG